MTEKLNTCYVRSLPLQREIIDSEDGSKSLQGYKAGAKVELTDSEMIRYQHLIESEEQYNSRQPKTTSKRGEK